MTEVLSLSDYRPRRPSADEMEAQALLASLSVCRTREEQIRTIVEWSNTVRRG